MTLRVPFADFPTAAARYEIREVFIAAKHGHTEVTGLMAKSGRVLYTCTEASTDEVKQALSGANLDVFEGAWLAEPPEPDAKTSNGEVYICAVSYESDEAMPGVWVDAYPWLPTPVQVLRGLYDEFRDTGELADVPFEEFVRQASPNVVIVGPNEIEGFLADKVES